MECLLKAGADVAAVDASGCTALDLAVQWQGKSEGAPTAQEGEQGAGGGKRQYGRVLEILQTWHATPGQASAGGRGGGQTAQRQPGGGPGHASQQENMEGAAGVSGGGLKETFKVGLYVDVCVDAWSCVQVHYVLTHPQPPTITTHPQPPTLTTHTHTDTH